MIWGRYALVVAFVVSAYCLCSCSSNTSMSGGAKDKQDATEEEKTKDKEETKRPTLGETNDGGETDGDDSDLSVIPPEVVSAAFLTCSNENTGTSPGADEVHYGCIVLDKEGKPAQFNTARGNWSLKNNDQEDIPHKNVQVPAHSAYHKIYGLAKTTYDAGVSPEFKVKASDSVEYVIKRKGQVTINGEKVQ